MGDRLITRFSTQKTAALLAYMAFLELEHSLRWPNDADGVAAEAQGTQ